MGQRYLIDSNVIIDFCNGKLPDKARKLLIAIQPEISIITNIEIFAIKNISAKEYEVLKNFMAITTIHSVNAELVDTTIAIRQDYRLKLPDAIIAATSLLFDLTLLSHNSSDFGRINGLKLFDPYDL